MDAKGRDYDCVLTIAGSDSGGGAGVQADLKTFAALGCYGMSAISALTAQNTVGVRAVHLPPAEFLQMQIQTVVEDIKVDAVKIGMLYSSAMIRTVATAIREFQLKNIVVDPVMVAKSGDKLLQEEAVAALRNELLPLATIITPNIPEAEILSTTPIKQQAQMLQACEQLLQLGADAILLKGGHLESSSCDDLLYYRETGQEPIHHWLHAAKVDTKNTHGTGCTLSAAIAAYLAKGHALKEAVEKAKQYVSAAIAAATTKQLGHGHGPLHHFYALWKD